MATDRSTYEIGVVAFFSRFEGGLPCIIVDCGIDY